MRRRKNTERERKEEGEKEMLTNNPTKQINKKFPDF